VDGVDRSFLETEEPCHLRWLSRSESMVQRKPQFNGGVLLKTHVQHYSIWKGHTSDQGRIRTVTSKTCCICLSKSNFQVVMVQDTEKVNSSCCNGGGLGDEVLPEHQGPEGTTAFSGPKFA